MAGNHDCPECRATYGRQMTSERQDKETRGDTYNTKPASPENGRSSPSMFNPYYTGRLRTSTSGSRANTIDRQEIIRRLKSRDSRPTSPEYEQSMSDELSHKRKAPEPESRPLDHRSKSPEALQNNQAAGMGIERPRSALHRGDFRENIPAEPSHERFSSLEIEPPMPALSTSPVAPWRSAFPLAALRSGQQEQYRSLHELASNQQTRARATSTASSLGSSFVYKPPTSPLVQSSRPDTPEGPSRRQSRSPDKSRRHTFSPQSFPVLSSATGYPASARIQGGYKPPTLRVEKTFPYQAHQPRRSLNSTPFSSLPQTPSTGPRRPSFSDSPLHHAPMVGSYEESILRGRMSTTPSKPLDFVAQIGVLGKGNCKSSLRCPRHVSVPFPAVFYSYGSGNRTSPTGDQPSPYVGLVDLENTLSPPPEDAQDKRRQRMHDRMSSEGSRANSQVRDDASASDVQARRRRRHKNVRHSGSPKTPPGGSYRIPQQGQLQIVIKNPNKTAVKLFLVPYDLSDMEPGHKTFIRQRSYSAGPIIDMPLTSRKNFGTDRPEAALSATGDPNDKPTLRYLIHIHICCPSKGRFYLYKSVRVVFANRVPDGKEKLRNEIQLPEPKYSAYKPGRESNIGMSSPSIKSRSVMETSNPVAALRDWRVATAPVFVHSVGTSGHSDAHDMPMPTLPRHFSALATLESRPGSRQTSDGLGIDSDSQDARSPLASPTSAMHSPTVSPRLQEPFRFGCGRGRERRNVSQNESLLSQRLMDLAFERRRNEWEES